MQYPVSRGYSTSQITLHWVIVALVFFQLVFGDAMSHSLRAIGRGEAVDPSVATQATLHIWVGFAILAAVAIRIVLRLTKGAPPLPDGSAIVALLARLTHAAFYFLLVAMPVTGILAYWFVPSLGDLHELGKPVFIVLIVLHVVAALWHQFWLRDGLLMRMLKPGA
ncbi:MULTISPECIES: cytochrome b [Kaistia]|uniref:Cytochrome b/b6 domain-containing protein n=1 Tax=Kaistia nematophila TaxID=2994654 RepID=A0A9X3DZS7_9HYPH|nr:cytochrome b/b6 domain-containing protein [Kaistia nematophila]MCX5568343.1 cytochrome b/b6 domain-containing protein [Kaistia nematophila]